MPIVSISKIQHRYGLSENLPQLSAAELGWAIDTRKLYIGNGPVSEGAPSIGNTEILTEYTNLLDVTDSYTYKGEAAGYTHQTGPSASSPVTRTLQRKIDDFASVKDFGAAGDGTTDDTAAINRALSQLFCQELNEEIRRSLFFPAGIYLITDDIKIPTYAKIYGEGKNSSIIRGGQVKLADSLQQIEASIGNNGAVSPGFVVIQDITFENTSTGDVLSIDKASNVRIQNVRISGNQSTAPASIGSAGSSVSLTSTAAYPAKNIVFEQCDIRNNVFGVVADDNDISAVTFNGCLFENLNKGFKISENTSGSGPIAIKVLNSEFDKIYDNAIHVYQTPGFISAFNYFKDVANEINGAGAAADSVIIYQVSGNTSFCDIFDRSDADDANFSRVDYNNATNLYTNPLDGNYFGRSKTEPGRSITLNDNSAAANTTITFSASTESANLIYYTATRDTNVRQGVMRITATSNGSTLTDEFNEDGTDIGLEFSVAVAAGVTTLKYDTTSTGDNITFKYRIERLI